jgi:hypothetical protein
MSPPVEKISFSVLVEGFENSALSSSSCATISEEVEGTVAFALSPVSSMKDIPAMECAP